MYDFQMKRHHELVCGKASLESTPAHDRHCCDDVCRRCDNDGSEAHQMTYRRKVLNITTVIQISTFLKSLMRGEIVHLWYFY